MNTLPVNEVFWSIQGEGSFTGYPAVFIRLQGCDVGCPFCDTRYAQKLDTSRKTLEEDVIFSKAACNTVYADLDVNLIVRKLTEHSPHRHIAVITGGEPCRYDLRPLSSALMAEQYPVHIETSGTEKIRCAPGCRITLSPKGKPVLAENWDLASEIKIPVSREEDILPYIHQLKRLDGKTSICLQPIDCQPKATALCIRLCQDFNFRLSVQLHKLIGIA